MTRIAGRARNLLTLPSGEKRFGVAGKRIFGPVEPVRQYQVVQKSVDRVEARMVLERPLTGEEEAGIRARLAAQLPGSFRITLASVSALPRAAGLSPGRYKVWVQAFDRVPDPVPGAAPGSEGPPPRDILPKKYADSPATETTVAEVPDDKPNELVIDLK